MVGGGGCYEMQVEDDHVGLLRVPCTKIYTQPSIVCDSCLTWYHFKCESLAKQPKSKTWFCRGCHAAAKVS